MFCFVFLLNCLFFFSEMCHGNYQLLYHEINIGRWVHWALRFGADCLKIKLLEITEEVGV